VDGALAAFGEHLQGRAAQDCIDAVADFAPHGTHRAGVAAMTRRVAAFFQAFDGSEVAFDDLGRRPAMVIFAGWRASR